MSAEVERKKVVKFAPDVNVNDGEPTSPVEPPAQNDLTSGPIDTSHLKEQNLETLDVSKLTPLTPEVISRQATINIGTIGHVAHGKSTVVKAISGVHTVRFKTELERNITIRLGYANAKLYQIDPSTIDVEKSEVKSDFSLSSEYYCSKGSAHPDRFKVDTDASINAFGEQAEYQLVRHISFVDCPGHDILMATMLTGAAIMDAALLLVAADQFCPQPQTNEHLAAIEIMKLKHIIILQNKIDLVTKEDALNQQDKIKDFIKGTIAESAPVIPVSAQLKLNIDIICQYLTKNVPIPLRDFSSKPRLMVIRSFDVNKPGCEVDDLQGGIAGGSILHGVFRLGDQVEIRPGVAHKNEVGVWKARPLITKIVSLCTEKNQLQYAVPGGLIGVGLTLDPFMCRSDNLVGNIIGLPGTLPNTLDMVEVSFYLMRRLAGARTEGKKQAKINNLTRGEDLQVNIGSFCTTASVRVVQNDQCRLELHKPICSEVGEKVAISRRIERHWRLIGWGEIVRAHAVELDS